MHKDLFLNKNILKKGLKLFLYTGFVLFSAAVVYVSFLAGRFTAESKIFYEIDKEYMAVCMKYSYSQKICEDRLY